MTTPCPKKASPPRHIPTAKLLQGLWERLVRERRGVLFLDYDGTLAPFRSNPYEATPYPGVPRRLDRLAALPCRLVLVTGRALESLLPLLKGVKNLPEIWANHGMEVMKPGKERMAYPVDSEARSRLDEARQWIEGKDWNLIYEAKPTSLAVHWRGRPEGEQRLFRQEVEKEFNRLAKDGRVHILPFDGGMELRVKGRNKGDVVRDVLSEEGDPPSAYLGDDITDEDAFASIRGRGIGLLVRDKWRETKAEGWLVPPSELLWFLDMWIMCLRGEN